MCTLGGYRGEAKKKKGKSSKELAEGEVEVEEWEEVRAADMLIARGKHFSAVVIRAEAVTSLAC